MRDLTSNEIFLISVILLGGLLLDVIPGNLLMIMSYFSSRVVLLGLIPIVYYSLGVVEAILLAIVITLILEKSHRYLIDAKIPPEKIEEVELIQRIKQLGSLGGFVKFKKPETPHLVVRDYEPHPDEKEVVPMLSYQERLETPPQLLQLAEQGGFTKLFQK
jgi:hypothetical protein